MEELIVSPDTQVSEQININFTLPDIKFEGYETCMKKAHEVADYIGGIELTEDNVQEVKQTLANSRKVVNALEDRRIAIKKQILEPYRTLELQIKSITQVVDDADSNLRSQVREMEEKDRARKQTELEDIWNKRIALYAFNKYIDNAFEKWLQPEYLNKTTSFKKAEDEMVTWMERVEKDIAAVLAMSDSKEIMAEYSNTLDLAGSIEAVKRQAEYKKKVFTAEDEATFIIKGKANIKLVEMLLKENSINYMRRD